MTIKEKIKLLVKKILYPNTYSSEAYANYLRKMGVKIGDGVVFYGPKNTTIDVAGGSGKFIEMGENVQITQGVIVLAHDYSYSVLGNVFHDLPRVQKKTYIGNNVFIGMNSIVLMGSHIGDNTIIGAGSVVSGHIEPNSVYAGNPARKIRSLEEHYQKCKEKFEDSARCFIEVNFDGNYENVDMNRLGVYQALFVDETKLRDYIEHTNLQGVPAGNRKKINMEYPRYSGIKEFMGEKNEDSSNCTNEIK